MLNLADSAGSMTEVSKLIDQLLVASRTFFVQELPDLLALSAEALRKAPFPASIAGAQKLSRDQIFQLVPTFCALTYATVLPFCWVYNERHHAKPKDRRKNSYWLTRVALIRGVALCYLAAFSTSAFQARGLFGSLGLQPVHYSPKGRPAPAFWLLTDADSGLGMPFDDWMLELVSWTGVLLSLLMLTSTVTTALLPISLWLLYLSIVNLGGWVINYGWEWLTLELGFLTIFLSPFLSIHLSSFPRQVPPPRLILWLFRWCAFRLLFGAGMSKLGGNSSRCWKELTCTTTHYFTQPMPNPLAWYFHHLPPSVHQLEVLLTFLEQIALPFALLLPLRSARIGAALAELFLQAGIVGTGNYAWINLVGVVPCLAVLDDSFLSSFFSPSSVAAAAAAADGEDGEDGEDGVQSLSSQAAVSRLKQTAQSAVSMLARAVRTFIYVAIVALIAFKSTAPLKELYGPSPWLHFYDDYFLVSAQGVFGFINAHRPTLALSFTHDELQPPPPPPPEASACRDAEGVVARDQGGGGLTCDVLADFCDTHPQVKAMCRKTCGDCKQARSKLLRSDGSPVHWRPLEFKNLPGDPAKAPGFNSPYHYRLDWQVWIHTTARLEQQALQGRPLPVPAFVSTLARKVLAGDTDAAALLGTPFHHILAPHPTARSAGVQSGESDSTEGLRPPTAIKAEYFWYTFSKPGSNASKAGGAWWERKRIKGSGGAHELRVEEDKWDGEVRRGAPMRGWLLLASTLSLLLAIRHSLRFLFGPPHPPCTLADTAKTGTKASSSSSTSSPTTTSSTLMALLRCKTALVMLPISLAAFSASLLADYPHLASSVGLHMVAEGGVRCYRAVQFVCQVGGAVLGGYGLMALQSEGLRAVWWCSGHVALVAAMWTLAGQAAAFHALL